MAHCLHEQKFFPGLSLGPLTMQVDFLGESTEGNLHLVDDPHRQGVVNVFGLHSLEDIINVPVAKLAAATQARETDVTSPESAKKDSCCL